MLVFLAVAINVAAWWLTIAWANHVNDYTWGQGHPGFPRPPTWLPIPKEMYWELNLYLAAICGIASVGVGVVLARIRVLTAVLVSALGVMSALVLILLSMLATF